MLIIGDKNIDKAAVGSDFPTAGIYNDRFVYRISSGIYVQTGLSFSNRSSDIPGWNTMNPLWQQSVNMLDMDGNNTNVVFRENGILPEVNFDLFSDEDMSNPYFNYGIPKNAYDINIYLEPGSSKSFYIDNLPVNKDILFTFFTFIRSTEIGIGGGKMILGDVKIDMPNDRYGINIYTQVIKLSTDEAVTMTLYGENDGQYPSLGGFKYQLIP